MAPDIIFINPKANCWALLIFSGKKCSIGTGYLQLICKNYTVKIVDEEVEKLTVEKSSS